MAPSSAQSPHDLFLIRQRGEAASRAASGGSKNEMEGPMNFASVVQSLSPQEVEV